MTLAQLRALAASIGFLDPDLAAAVAMAESGGNAGAVGDEGTSFGLWQIHTPAHPEYDANLLLEADYNARAAYAISSGGTVWQPWSTYNSGAYLKFYSGKLLFGLARSTWLAIAIGAAGSLIIYSELYGMPKPLKALRRAF